MKLFEAKNYFKYILNENMSSEMLTPLDMNNISGNGGDIGNGDNYAPGDNRIPYSIFSGIIKRNDKSINKKKKKSNEEDAEELFDYEHDDLTPEEWELADKLQDKTGKSIHEVVSILLKRKGTFDKVNLRERLKRIAELKASLKD